MLPYDLVIKDVFPENIKVITDFSKKTGDYPSLSATDIKVMALTYQLEKEKVGTSHLRTEPIVNKVVATNIKPKSEEPVPTNISGFYLPANNEIAKDEESEEDYKDTQEKEDIELSEKDMKQEKNVKEESESEEESDEGTEEIVKRNEGEDINEKFAALNVGELEDTIEGQKVDDILASVNNEDQTDSASEGENSESGFDDDDEGWITPNNVQKVKKQMNDDFVEDKSAVVACITTDFAMQNVLKQMKLNVAALDGRMIKQIRTFILRCHTCFKTTSLMEKVFCPKCGNKTLKKVAVSLTENGKQVIHINLRKPLTSRGKKFSLPKFKGGKHSSNPILSEDQPMPQQRPTRQARMKNNPMDPDYTAGTVSPHL